MMLPTGQAGVQDKKRKETKWSTVANSRQLLLVKQKKVLVEAVAAHGTQAGAILGVKSTR
jgi:hypothetical protein